MNVYVTMFVCFCVASIDVLPQPINDQRIMQWVRGTPNIEATDKFILAVKNGNLVLVESLIRNGANINFITANGKTALHYASTLNTENVAELLLRYGANPNVKDSTGDTPLILAVSTGNEKIAELLIKNGAGVNLANNEGMTALHRSVSFGSEKLTALLIENGANINLKNKNNQTPFQLTFPKRNGVMGQSSFQPGPICSFFIQTAENVAQFFMNQR